MLIGMQVDRPALKCRFLGMRGVGGRTDERAGHVQGDPRDTIRNCILLLISFILNLINCISKLLYFVLTFIKT